MMTRRPKTIAFWVGRLPHWEVEGGRYFVTIHLAGAIPLQGRQRLRRLAAEVRSKDKSCSEWLSLQRAIFRQMEQWLDRSQWSPKLRNPQIASMIIEGIEDRQRRGDWNVFEYVVMPTHLHLFAEIPHLKKTLEGFKRWTGHRAAKMLQAKEERFWQREWFDHWSRSDDEDERIAQYIRNNPEKAGLVKAYTQWVAASWSRSRLPGVTLSHKA